MLKTRARRDAWLAAWGAMVALAFAAILGLHTWLELTASASPPSNRFSRSLTIGQSDVNSMPAVTVSHSGGVAILWVNMGQPSFAIVDDTASIRQSGVLRIPGQVVRNLRETDGWLFWRDEKTGALSAAQVDLPSGTLRNRQRLFPEILDYEVVRAGFEESGDDFYVLAATMRGPVALAHGPDGFRPLAAPKMGEVSSVGGVVTSDGLLHAAFMERLDAYHYVLWHAAYSPKAGWTAVDREADVLNLDRGSVGAVRVGADAEDLYFFYSRETFPSGKSTVYYLCRSLSGERSSGAPITLPSGLVPGASRLSEPSPVEGQSEALLVAVTASVQRRGDEAGADVLTARFRGGRLTGADLASRSAGAAIAPRTFTASGRTYVSFLKTNGFGSYTVNLTADTRQFAAKLNRITPADVGNAALNALLSVFSFFGVLFFVSGTWIPAFMWLIVSGFLAMLWTERNPIKTLAVSLALYGAGKFWLVLGSFYAPAMRSAMPLWLSRPWVGALVALVTYAIALSGVVLRWRKERVHSPLTSLAFFAAVDSALTLFTFGPFLR